MFILLTKRFMDSRKGLENYEIRFKTLTMLKALKEICGKEKAYLFIWNTFACRHSGIKRLWMHAHKSSASLGKSGEYLRMVGRDDSTTIIHEA